MIIIKNERLRKHSRATVAVRFLFVDNRTRECYNKRKLEGGEDRCSPLF